MKTYSFKAIVLSSLFLCFPFYAKTETKAVDDLVHVSWEELDEIPAVQLTFFEKAWIAYEVFKWNVKGFSASLHNHLVRYKDFYLDTSHIALLSFALARESCSSDELEIQRVIKLFEEKDHNAEQDHPADTEVE